MLGKPKYKVGTTVKFIFRNQLKTGVIWIVDKYGTWDYTEDVSYDIMVKSDGTFISCTHYRRENEIFKTKEELLKSL